MIQGIPCLGGSDPFLRQNDTATVGLQAEGEHLPLHAGQPYSHLRAFPAGSSRFLFLNSGPKVMLSSETRRN